ncbi:MAG TPA: hypothetical protein VKZ49_15810, partial [Polyangiaceae bacterium]|nr:hypothetical protein [Polyangiaceae bacterium]
MLRRVLSRCGLLLVSWLAAGCGAGAGPQLDERQEGVVGGEGSPAGGDDDAVLLLRAETEIGEVICTATLIAPNLVVTTLHCVAITSPEPV